MFPKSKSVSAQIPRETGFSSSGLSGLLTNALTRNGGSAGPGLRDALQRAFDEAPGKEFATDAPPMRDFPQTGRIQPNTLDGTYRPRWRGNPVPQEDGTLMWLPAENMNIWDAVQGKLIPAGDVLFDTDDNNNGVPDSFEDTERNSFGDYLTPAPLYISRR